jgi:cell shape-determining protein MreC
VYFKDKEDLEERVKQLQVENTDLKLENLLNHSVSQEFEYFKNQFGTSSVQDNSFKVILRPPFTPFDNLRITGKLEPYQVGDLVSYKSILIGKIVEKSNRYATVELFSSPEKSTPIVVKGTQFEAKGLGGGRFVFEVGKDFEINEGEPVIYPEQDILVLGVVEFVESKEEDLFKKIYFNLPVPLDMISYVMIGTKQYEQNTPTN